MCGSLSISHTLLFLQHQVIIEQEIYGYCVSHLTRCMSTSNYRGNFDTFWIRFDNLEECCLHNCFWRMPTEVATITTLNMSGVEEYYWTPKCVWIIVHTPQVLVFLQHLYSSHAGSDIRLLGIKLHLIRCPLKTTEQTVIHLKEALSTQEIVIGMIIIFQQVFPVRSTTLK